MQVEFLVFDTYLNTIEKSVGSDLFKTTWAKVDGKKKDITNSGQYSCASHVSSILLWFTEFGLLSTRHTGLEGLLKDMKKCGWYKIEKPKPGAVLHWEKMLKNGEENEHIGFYVGGEIAISNERDAGVPIRHHYTYGERDGKPARKIEAIYWHPKLDNK